MDHIITQDKIRRRFFATSSFYFIFLWLRFYSYMMRPIRIVKYELLNALGQ